MATRTKESGIENAGAGSKKATAGNRKAAAGGEKAAAGRKKTSKPMTEEPTDTDKPSPKTADARSMGAEAFSVMGERSSKIIERLLVQMMQGDMKSAEMLVKLANKEDVAMELLRHGPLRSQALAWAAELPWEDEVDPPQAETGGGSPEPKMAEEAV